MWSHVSCVRDQMVAGKVKKPGKRGRKPAKIDLKAKLERSRQSARECRARKKLRYQYLEELVSSKERAICALREELEMVRRSKHLNTLKTRCHCSCRTLHVVHTLTCSAGESHPGVSSPPQYKQWCSAMDQGKIPSEIKALLTGDEQKTPQSGSSTKTSKNSKNISSNGQV